MRVLYFLCLITFFPDSLAVPLEPRADCDAGPSQQDVQDTAGSEAVANDGPTTDRSAGLGIEFESPGFRLKNEDCGLQDTQACRQMTISDNKGPAHQGLNWKLTVDSTENAGDLRAEYILDGKELKIGVNAPSDGGPQMTLAGAAAKAIENDMMTMNPQVGVLLSLPSDKAICQIWKVAGLRRVKGGQDPAMIGWGPQVTAPMPLEALYSLMQEQMTERASDGSDGPLNILVGDPAMRPGWAGIVVQKDFFQSRPNNLDPSTMTDDVLGFCSLVLTYAKSAKQLIYGQSPKLFSTFMPRTEFKTMFEMIQSHDLGDLFDLFDILACYKNGDRKNNSPTVIDSDFCDGPLNAPTSNGNFAKLMYVASGVFTDKGEKNPLQMNVEDWIRQIGDPSASKPDLWTVFDKGIDGSIGGLNDAIENIVGGTRAVPLFEFRDITSVNTKTFIYSDGFKVFGFQEFVQSAEQAVIDLHRRFATRPAAAKRRKRQDSCTLSSGTVISDITITPTAVHSGSSALSAAATTAGAGNPEVSCTYNDKTPENPTANCECVSQSSTITVQPMSLASVSVITQSCDYTTWPGQQPTITAPPASVTTNLAACEICTIIGPNEDNCTPMPTSLGCIPATPTTILSGATFGVNVGTMTGSALYSAITSAVDKVCQIPANTGAAVGSFTCDEAAIAAVASNVRYKSGDNFEDDGILTLQMKEGSYDSLEWYETSKAVIAAFAQNSTQNNCQNVSGEPPIIANPAGHFARDGWGSQGGGGEHDQITDSICKVGSNFQLIETNPLTKGAPRELSFDLAFSKGTDGDFICQFIENVLEFIELTVNAQTGTEAALPEEFELDEKMVEACEKSLGR